MSEYIEIVELDDSTDNEIADNIAEMTWDDLVSEFSDHEFRVNKNGACFMPAEFKPMEDWVITKSLKSKKPGYRNDSNISAITMAVIDLDEKGSLEKAQEKFKHYDRFVYSTFSYTAEANYKFRMVIRLAEPVPAKEWPDAFARIAEGVSLDTKCRNLSRIFFKPSHSVDNDVSPVFCDFKGSKILSLEEIKGFDISEESKNSFNGYSTSISLIEKRNRKHYLPGDKSNKFQKRFQYNGRIDYTYSGMSKRHEKSIKEFIKSPSRHEYALSVIFREISFYGRKTDLSKLSKFLFVSSSSFASAGILQAGNTLEELPEMMMSSMMKTEDGIYMPILDRDIKNAIRSAMSEVSSHPLFPSKEAVDELVSTFDERPFSVKRVSENDLLHEISERCRPSKEGILEKEGNWRRFCYAVLKVELHNQGTTISIPDVLSYAYNSGKEQLCDKKGLDVDEFNKNTFPQIKSEMVRVLSGCGLNMMVINALVESSVAIKKIEQEIEKKTEKKPENITAKKPKINSSEAIPVKRTANTLGF